MGFQTSLRAPPTTTPCTWFVHTQLGTHLSANARDLKCASERLSSLHSCVNQASTHGLPSLGVIPFELLDQADVLVKESLGSVQLKLLFSRECRACEQLSLQGLRSTWQARGLKQLLESFHLTICQPLKSV